MANISDAGYVGMYTTVNRLTPLLESPRCNTYPTTITLFLSTVMEVVHRHDEREATPNIDLLIEYLPTPNLMNLMQPDNADMLRIWHARALVMDVDKSFRE